MTAGPRLNQDYPSMAPLLPFAIDRIGSDGLAAGYPEKRFLTKCYDVTCRYGYQSQVRAVDYGMFLSRAEPFLVKDRAVSYALGAPYGITGRLLDTKL